MTRAQQVEQRLIAKVNQHGHTGVNGPLAISVAYKLVARYGWHYCAFGIYRMDGTLDDQGRPGGVLSDHPMPNRIRR